MTVCIIGGNWDSGNWVKLYNEKRQDLEEQQLHLSVGLQKIRETVEQVEELQASLSIKKNELEQLEEHFSKSRLFMISKRPRRRRSLHMRYRKL